MTSTDRERLTVWLALGAVVAIGLALDAGWTAVVAFVAIWSAVPILIAVARRLPGKVVAVIAVAWGIGSVAWCLVVVL